MDPMGWKSRIRASPPEMAPKDGSLVASVDSIPEKKHKHAWRSSNGRRDADYGSDPRSQTRISWDAHLTDG